MKKLVFIICLLGFSLFVSSQPLVEKIFDFDNIDYASDIINLEEGGFLILGSTTIDGVGMNVFIRINENGDTLWTKTKPYYGNSIVQYDASHYYIAGSYTDGETGYSYGVLSKIDQNCDRIWLRTYPYSYGYSRLSNLKKSSNGELVLNWYRILEDWQTPPMECLNAYDTSGNVLWSADCSMVMNDFEQLPNENYIKLGKNDYGIHYDFISTYTSTGNYIDGLSLGDNSSAILNEIVLYGDTAFIAGTGDAINIFKIDTENSELIWQKEYLIYFCNIKSAYNGLNNEILITGNYKVDSYFQTFILTINSNGDSISTSYIDKFHIMNPAKIISNDESYYLIGTIENEDESKDIYFLKAPLDTVLVSTKEINHTLVPNHFQISPNPANNNVNFSIDIENHTELQIRIANINGIGVYNKLIAPNQTQHQIDISAWQSGIYIITLLQDGKILQREKLIVKR